MTRVEAINRFFHNDPNDSLLQYLLSEGFCWSEEHGCFRMETERFRHWNNRPMTLAPISVQSDAFHRATNR